EALHDGFADGTAGDFRFAFLAEGALDVVHDFFQDAQRDGPLFARGDQAGQDLLPLERFAPPVLLHDQQRRFLPALVGRKASAAVFARAPVPDRLAFFGRARVEDFRFIVPAERTPHNRSLLPTLYLSMRVEAWDRRRQT